MKRGKHVLAIAGMCGALALATAPASVASPKVGATWLSQETVEPSPEPIPLTTDSLPPSDSVPGDSGLLLHSSSGSSSPESTTSQVSASEFTPLTLSELLESSLEFSEHLPPLESPSLDQLLTLQIKQNQQMAVMVSLGLSLVVLLLTANLVKR